MQISAAGRAARFERNVTVLAGATALAIGSYLALAVHGFWGTALAVGTIFTTVCSLDIKTKFKAQYDGAQTAWEEQRTIWRNQAGPEKFEKARNHYLSLANTHAKLPAKEHEMLNALEQKKREIQFISYMKSQSIDRAKISGIGQGRKVTLASYGFQTAWDVRNGRIGSVPGFGPSLVGKWRHGRVRSPRSSFSTRQSLRTPKLFKTSKTKLVNNARRSNANSATHLMIYIA